MLIDSIARDGAAAGSTKDTVGKQGTGNSNAEPVASTTTANNDVKNNGALL